MKRKEFIESFVRLVDAGRLKNFPDMRPAERAAGSVEDAEKAAQVWRKHRAYLSAKTVAEWEASQAPATKRWTADEVQDVVDELKRQKDEKGGRP